MAIGVKSKERKKGRVYGWGDKDAKSGRVKERGKTRSIMMMIMIEELNKNQGCCRV